MRARPIWLLVSVWLLLAASASPALAQATRDQWLALRLNKESERALTATTAGNNSATRNNVLTVVSLQFFADASGHLVAVGEARNASTVTLSYARLEFAFYDAAGSYLGSDQAYLHGGRNKLVLVLGWKIVGSGDFNRDGWQDLVWQHQGDGRISVWTMRGAALVEGDLISPGQIFDLDWKIRGVGDINGDDMPDLIWQHRVSGDVSTWLMNGTTMISGIGIGRVPDTNWQIVGPR